MSTNLDQVHRGLTRAFERQRAMQQQKSHHAQTVQEFDGNRDEIITNDAKPCGVFSASTKLSDEQYRTAIIEAMVNHIKQKKGKQNDC